MKFVVNAHIHTHYESMIEAPDKTTALAIWYEILDKDIKERRICTYDNIRSVAQEYGEEAAEKRMLSMEQGVPTGFYYKDSDGILRYKDLVDGVELEFDSDGKVVPPAGV